MSQITKGYKNIKLIGSRENKRLGLTIMMQCGDFRHIEKDKYYAGEELISLLVEKGIKMEKTN